MCRNVFLKTGHFVYGGSKKSAEKLVKFAAKCEMRGMFIASSIHDCLFTFGMLNVRIQLCIVLYLE